MVHKILFIIDNLEFGGGERGFLQLIKGLDKQRYNIHVASKPSGKFAESIREMDIPLLPLIMENKYNPIIVGKLTHIINKGKYQIVHSQGARCDFFSRIAVRLSQRPYLISTIQMPVDGFNVNTLRKSVYRFFDRFSEKYVDRFIVVSDVLKSILINSHHIPSDKIVKIYNGVEMARFNLDFCDQKSPKVRKSFGLNSSHTVIGAIGRFTWQKGFKYLIHSIPSIIQNHPRTKFLLVGEGPLKKELEDLAGKLNIKENIIFPGFRNNIDNILSAVDIFVVPSILEGFPMVILEAMAMARPIIASNIPGISEQIINGSTGILVPPKSSEAISKTLTDLIVNQNKAKRIGEKAMAYVNSNFSVEKMVFKTQKIYQELLEGNINL